MSKSVEGQSTVSVGAQLGEETTTETISRDDAFEVLSNQRRRYTLHYLQHNRDDATLSDVAEQVAAWENEKGVPEVASSERKTVYTSLQQFHLPKLDAQGVVEFDQRSGEIELTERAADLDIYLEVVDQYDIPWSYYYLGLSLVGTILVALSWAGIAPFAGIPFIGWAAFLLGAFFVSSVSHMYLTREMRLGSSEIPPEVRP
jgi:hypothetical protein